MKQRKNASSCIGSAWLLLAGALVLSGLSGCSSTKREAAPSATAEQQHHAEEKAKEADEVSLTPEALAAAKLEFAAVTARQVSAALRVTGSVEVNQERIQQATPLVSGRIERVFVALGDHVQVGQPLATISSPQIAQMHGKLHEAETQYALAVRELERVQRAENRVAVLSAKAKLDEAEAALKRTRRLIEVGAGAGKDLIAAETTYRTAKAEYEFQSNIALNKELQEARAAVETARVDVAHIRDEMKSLGAPVSADERREHGGDHSRDTSLIVLRSPVTGTVTERLVNAGAGIEAGKPLFTIANLSTVWVIANVPEAQVSSLRIGTPARVTSGALGEEVRTARITYLDPVINEETRTAKVRVELTNPRERLKPGMFVEVEFEPTTQVKDAELTVPEAAVQRLEGRTIVFVAEEKEPGHFKVREVELGGERNGSRVITGGLSAGEQVVTKGSFTLKAQLQKGELGEEH